MILFVACCGTWVATPDSRDIESHRGLEPRRRRGALGGRHGANACQVWFVTTPKTIDWSSVQGAGLVLRGPIVGRAGRLPEVSKVPLGVVGVLAGAMSAGRRLLGVIDRLNSNEVVEQVAQRGSFFELSRRGRHGLDVIVHGPTDSKHRLWGGDGRPREIRRWVAGRWRLRVIPITFANAGVARPIAPIAPSGDETEQCMQMAIQSYHHRTTVARGRSAGKWTMR